MIIDPNELLSLTFNAPHVLAISSLPKLLSNIPLPTDYASIKNHMVILEASLSQFVFFIPDSSLDYGLAHTHTAGSEGVNTN